MSISGATGSAAVTAADVQVGDYTLAETGPTGYTASRLGVHGRGVDHRDARSP